MALLETPRDPAAPAAPGHTERPRGTRPARRRRSVTGAVGPLGVGISAAALGVVLGSWMLLAGIGIIASQVALLTRDADR